MSAESARHKKANKDRLIAAAEVSVKILSAPSLILFVIGIAEDDDDIKRYATICNQKLFQSSVCPKKIKERKKIKENLAQFIDIS